MKLLLLLTSLSTRSVVEFFQGYLGQPVGGFPEPLRSKIIRDKKRIDERPGKDMEPYAFEKVRKGESV
jgi:pyruvate carboxylase